MDAVVIPPSSSTPQSEEGPEVITLQEPPHQEASGSCEVPNQSTIITWTCEICSFENQNQGEDSDVQPWYCMACYFRRDGTAWVCHECSYHNRKGKWKCICGSVLSEEQHKGRSRSRAAHAAILSDYKRRKKNCHKRPSSQVRGRGGSSGKRRATRKDDRLDDEDRDEDNGEGGASSSTTRAPEVVSLDSDTEGQEEPPPDEEEEDDRYDDEISIDEVVRDSQMDIWQEQKAYCNNMVKRLEKIPGFTAIMSAIMRGE